MIRYYLYAMYGDGSTRCGTDGNMYIEGNNIKKALSNFKKKWHGYEYNKQKVVGVEIRKYVDFNSVEVDIEYF